MVHDLHGLPEFHLTHLFYRQARQPGVQGWSDSIVNVVSIGESNPI